MTPLPLPEARALREFYSRRVISAMARRFPAGGENGWREVVDSAARQPYGAQAEALKLYQERIACMTDWSAINRFLFHADKVWEIESDVMMDSPYARRRQVA